jgi:IS30 family transposase
MFSGAETLAGGVVALRRDEDAAVLRPSPFCSCERDTNENHNGIIT